MIFDTTTKLTLEFAEHEPIELKVGCAGGGTRFDGPISTLDEMQVTPEVLVYLTDLDGTIFAAEPHYPVVWVTTNKTVAPYGDIIQMH